jgi:hypothetical protein
MTGSSSTIPSASAPIVLCLSLIHVLFSTWQVFRHNTDHKRWLANVQRSQELDHQRQLENERQLEIQRRHQMQVQHQLERHLVIVALGFCFDLTATILAFLVSTSREFHYPPPSCLPSPVYRRRF